MKKSTKVFKEKEKKIHSRQVTRWSASVALVKLDIDTKRRVLADMLGQCHQMKDLPPFWSSNFALPFMGHVCPCTYLGKRTGWDWVRFNLQWG